MLHIIFYPSGLQIISASLSFIRDNSDDENRVKYYNQLLDKIRQI